MPLTNEASDPVEFMLPQNSTTVEPTYSGSQMNFPTSKELLAGGVAIFVIAILLIWSTIIKGVALWRAGKNGHKGWFIAMYLINIVGILEVIYLLTAGKEKKVETANTPTPTV